MARASQTTSESIGELSLAATAPFPSESSFDGDDASRCLKLTHQAAAPTHIEAAPMVLGGLPRTHLIWLYFLSFVYFNSTPFFNIL